MHYFIMSERLIKEQILQHFSPLISNLTIFLRKSFESFNYTGPIIWDNNDDDTTDQFVIEKNTDKKFSIRFKKYKFHQINNNTNTKVGQSQKESVAYYLFGGQTYRIINEFVSNIVSKKLSKSIELESPIGTTDYDMIIKGTELYYEGSLVSTISKTKLSKYNEISDISNTYTYPQEFMDYYYSFVSKKIMAFLKNNDDQIYSIIKIISKLGIDIISPLSILDGDKYGIISKWFTIHSQTNETGIHVNVEVFFKRISGSGVSVSAGAGVGAGAGEEEDIFHGHIMENIFVFPDIGISSIMQNNYYLLGDILVPTSKTLLVEQLKTLETRLEKNSFKRDVSRIKYLLNMIDLIDSMHIKVPQLTNIRGLNNFVCRKYQTKSLITSYIDHMSSFK